MTWPPWSDHTRFRDWLRAGPLPRDALDPYSWPHLSSQLQAKCFRLIPKEVPEETTERPQLLGAEGRRTTDKELQRVELSRLQVQENSGHLGAQRLLSLCLPLMSSSSVCLCRATDIIEPILNATNSPASTLSEETETRDVATQDLRREEWRAENKYAVF